MTKLSSPRISSRRLSKLWSNNIQMGFPSLQLYVGNETLHIGNLSIGNYYSSPHPYVSTSSSHIFILCIPPYASWSFGTNIEEDKFSIVVLRSWNELYNHILLLNSTTSLQHFSRTPTWTLLPIFPASLWEIYELKWVRLLNTHSPTEGIPLGLGNCWTEVQAKLIIRLHWVCSIGTFIFSTLHPCAAVWHLLRD